MNGDLVKSLTSLIDETLQELEDLKKSRFSASEIKLDGPGSDGIAGKPANGHLGKDEDEKEDEDKDMDKGEDCADDMDKKEDEEDEDDMDKAEGKNASADPGAIHHGEGKDKGAGPREQTGGGKMRPASGTNSKADMGEIHKDEGPEMKKPKMAKKEDKKEKDEDEDEKMDWKMKKSQNEMTSLMKSFVDERIKPLEDKLSTIADLVNKVLDQPVAPRGFTARGVAPLAKSAEEFGETLNKSQVSSKLWELKKSGTYVDSLDVTKAEMGQELDSIVKKYKIS